MKGEETWTQQENWELTWIAVGTEYNTSEDR